MLSAYENLFVRIKPTAPAGKGDAIRRIISAGVAFNEAVEAVHKRDDLNPKGKALAIVAEIKNGPGKALLRARREAALNAVSLQKQRDALDKKVRGEPTPLDAEHRAVLRPMIPAERVQTVLKYPAFRQAALRGGVGLSGLTEEMHARAFDIAVKEIAPEMAAALVDRQEEQDLHVAATTILHTQLLGAMAVPGSDGSARKFANPNELEAFLAKEIPAPHPNAVHVEEAALDAA
jgi:hypothetical protein